MPPRKAGRAAPHRERPAAPAAAPELEQIPPAPGANPQQNAKHSSRNVPAAARVRVLHNAVDTWTRGQVLEASTFGPEALERLLQLQAVELEAEG